jgi:hypothetical protein
VRYVAALGAAMATALVLAPRTSAAQVAVGSASKAADADSEAVSLMYEDSPPPDCPSQAEFQAEVSKLTSKAHFTKQRRARRVRIELMSSGRDVVGRLVTGDGKNQSSREVRGKDCREVASALAIAVALTIDPSALGLDEPDTTAKPDDVPPTTSSEPPKPKTPPEPEQPEPKPDPKAAAPPPAEIATAVPLLWGLSLGLVLENAWAPRMRPGGRGAVTFGVGERFRASVGVTRFLTHEADDVSFGAWLADANVSVNLAVLGVLRPFATVGYEVGAVEAAGTGLPTTVQAQRPWQAGSAGLGLRFETDSFFLQLGGSLLVPVSRQRYLISDPFGEVRVLYEVPRVGLKQETSLGVFL